MTKLTDLPKNGFFVVTIYFNEYKDSTANDTRRSLNSMVEAMKKINNKNNVEHHLFGLIKKPPTIKGKKLSRAIGAVEMVRYKCSDQKQVQNIYQIMKRWCKKRKWNYEIMFADWLIESFKYFKPKINEVNIYG